MDRKTWYIVGGVVVVGGILYLVMSGSSTTAPVTTTAPVLPAGTQPTLLQSVEAGIGSFFHSQSTGAPSASTGT